MPERVYLDSCALNRLSDDLTQPRVREEAEAVRQVLDAAGIGLLHWIASTHLQSELGCAGDSIRRLQNLALLKRAGEVVEVTAAVLARALRLASHGIHAQDALHLSLALEAGVQTLLTTDDRLIRQARRAGTATMLVENPVDWLRRRRPWLLPNP